MSALIMIASASAIIVIVKYGLLRGLDHVSGAMKWSAKARGQVTGYATSVPELVCLVSAGLAGVWEAGLWNIASSNIINAGLLMSAVLWFRQHRNIFKDQFRDEIVFAMLAILVPIVLMYLGLDQQWYLVPLLLGFFAIYQVVDRRLNRKPTEHSDDDVEAVGSLPIGLILVLTALIAIAVAGVFLGDATAEVVQQAGIHPAVAGWILGVVTSIPEMVSFFAVFAAAKHQGELGSLNDMQEALDNLTGSNMSNVGVVYPLGLLAFLVATALFAG